MPGIFDAVAAVVDVVVAAVAAAIVDVVVAAVVANALDVGVAALDAIRVIGGAAVVAGKDRVVRAVDVVVDFDAVLNGRVLLLLVSI